MERRLERLLRLWPPEACPACISRPAIICVPHPDDPTPHYPEGVCRQCGRPLYTVPVLVGVDCDGL